MSSEILAQPAVDTPDRKRWIALAVIVAAQFMVVLDVAIVNVALPSIRTDLHFSQEGLQWVITAYSIFFGGGLLRRGRRPARRRPDERAQLVVDLLHQRARGRPRRRPQPLAAARKPSRSAAPTLRRRRRRIDHRRADAAGLRDDARGPARLGDRTD